MSIYQDLLYAFRLQAKNPGFAAIAILALALGIGANTAIFTVVNALLIRDLPYPDSDRLVMVFEKNRPRSIERNVVAPGNFRDWKSQNSVFERMAIFGDGRTGLIVGSSDPEEIASQIVSEGFFETLGVQPAIGRVFTAQEYQPGGPDLAVISHKLWTRRLASNPNIVGTTITLGGTRTTITGIMPAWFQTTNTMAEIWTPFRLDPGRDYRATSGRGPSCIARMKPGIPFAQARSEMDTIAARLEREYPAFNAGWGVTLVPLHENMVGDVRLAVLVLLAAVGCVLLIACANVANLLLARAASRRREMAIRASLGAGRGRVVRQLLTESVLLSVWAGMLGYLLATWGVDALIALSPKNLPMRDQIQPDAMVLAFNIGISLLTGILFGLMPALSATRTDLVVSLKQGAAGGGGTTGQKTRSTLIAIEVAVSLVLLIGAGLLIRSFMTLQSVNPGFDASQVLTARVNLSAKYREPEKRIAFFERTMEQLRRLPGVESASSVNYLPMTGMVSATGFTIEGQPEPAPGQRPTTEVSVVEPEFFRTMRIPLLRGRHFGPQDQSTSPRVYVVNETFAKRTFPDGDAIGKRIVVRMADLNPGEIIGVVGDIRYTRLTAVIRPTAYYTHTQFYQGSMYLLIRSAAPPENLARAVQAAVRSLDPELPLADVRPMDDVLAQSIATSRFTMMLLGVFASFALVLAAIGIYGVMAYSVTQRTQEIGVRMALGARAGDVLRLVMRQGMAIVSIGLFAGLVASFALTRLMKNLLYEVKPTDALTFAVVPCVLVAAAALATYLPARRATRVEPVRALRYE